MAAVRRFPEGKSGSGLEEAGGYLERERASSLRERRTR